MTYHSPKVALVTGAAKRVGAAISRALHQAGYNLALHYCHSKDAAKTLENELNSLRPGSAAMFQADLCSISQIEELSSAVVGHWGHLDALINNASTFYPTPLSTSTPTQWTELMGSNLFGSYFLVKSLATELTAQCGNIVLISDINARYPLQHYSIYCVAKAGAEAMTRVLACELAPNVCVNAIAPGSILWPEGEAAMSESAKRQLLAKIPLRRLGNPKDIAALAVLLAKNPCYITGQVIAVDGGLGLARKPD